MATVFLARDQELDRRVAVKVLAEHLAGDPAFRQRFLREARLAGRLAHPNVVGVYDAGEDGGLPYIVMEYVDGETLAELLERRGRLPPEEVAALGRQVCAGLANAHRAGLVHRDVKPQNLILSPDGTVKIADFGIARAAEETSMTEIGTILGTIAYLSPEQAAGERVTSAADVYSLGVVLYELLTGRTPYPAESLADLARDRPPPPVSDHVRDVPERLEDAIMRCLARGPDYRPSAAELETELAGSSEAATVPLPPRPVHRASRRRPVALAAVILLALAAAAVAIALAASGGGSSSKPAPRPASIQAPPRGSSPSDEARKLADWIRSYSR